MNWRKWLDDFVLAGKGILLATKEKRFWAGFIPSFLLFGILINLLSSGFTKFQTMWIMGFPGCFQEIFNALFNLFGYQMPFLDWLYVFMIALLQGILIGLIVLLWHKKRTDSSNSANVEKAGIITGLIALGAGCPTCGTTLITPLIGAVFSTSSFAITGAVSTIVTIAAIIVAVLSVKRLGLETYVIIVNEKYLRKAKNVNKN